MVLDLQSPHAPRKQLRQRPMLSRGRRRAHTLARGAPGMDTGIPDGYNLAGKVALAVKGQADERLLDTYNEERLENAKNLLRTTDRMFQLVAGPEWFLEFIRTNVFPAVAGFVFRFDAVKKFVFPLVSQIGINYRHGSLSRHDGDDDFKVKAGDRMPYFLVGGESIYDRLREPKFHLLVFKNEDVSAQTSEHSQTVKTDLV